MAADISSSHTSFRSSTTLSICSSVMGEASRTAIPSAIVLTEFEQNGLLVSNDCFIAGAPSAAIPMILV